MRITEKYDKIIDIIEENIYLKTEEITMEINQRLGISPRALSEGFQFVSDLSLSQYLRLRRVVRALQYWKEEGCALEAAALQMGYPDQPTLSKACKDVLCCTPKQVTQELLAEYPPLTFEQILKGEYEGMLAYKSDKSVNAFGITNEQYNLVSSLMEMNRWNQFDQEQLEMIYNTSKRYDVPLKEVFEFFELFAAELKSDPLEIDGYTYTKEEMIHLCYKHNMSSQTAWKRIGELRKLGYNNIFDIEEDALEVYLYLSKREYSFSVRSCGYLASVLHSMQRPVEDLLNFLIEAIYAYDGNLYWAAGWYGRTEEIFGYYREYGILPEGVEMPMYTWTVPELDEMKKKMDEEWGKI